jgi:hypothetical protein
MAEELLRKVGKVIHSSIAGSLSKYANIRACVLVDPRVDPVDGICVNLPNGSKLLVKVLYRDGAEVDVKSPAAHKQRLSPQHTSNR